MRNYHLLNWLIPATMGLSMLFPAAAFALGIVDYTPSTTFTLNPSAGNLNQDLGVVQVQSDSPNGWILKVRSTERGTLRHVTHPSAVPYTLIIDGVQVSSLTSGEDVTALTKSALTCDTGCTLSVQATMLASDIDGKPSGSYSDTLVFTLVNQ